MIGFVTLGVLGTVPTSRNLIGSWYSDFVSTVCVETVDVVGELVCVPSSASGPSPYLILSGNKTRKKT